MTQPQSEADNDMEKAIALMPKLYEKLRKLGNPRVVLTSCAMIFIIEAKMQGASMEDICESLSKLTKSFFQGELKS
jgi:hypothetical protein